MAYRDLHEFVRRLDENGQLRRITVPVSAELEITEITDRVSKGPASGNVALLFENVQGSILPVLTNAFGSAERMAWALGVDNLDDLGANLERMIALDIPGNLPGKLKRLSELMDVPRALPRTVSRAPCQQVVETDTASLDSLPILKCWPDDGGRYITLPAVITRDPATGKRNVGMYRLQVFDERTLGMHWQRHKGGADHQRAGERIGQVQLPAAIALGGDPAVTYAASAPLPQGIDEMLLAGWLRGRGVEMVKCVTVDLEVPAASDIVIEGHVDLSEHRMEGPFGDHTGYYSLADLYPVFHVSAITRRKDAIYPATVVGRPPMEDFWMGKATERLFLPLIRLMLPDVVDINMPAEGVFHNLVIVSIRKRYPGQARSVLYGLWGLGLMMLSKIIVIVDEQVDVHDLSEVAWRVGNSVDPARDLIVVEGPADDLDHASLRPGYGGKLGIDATAKGPGDGFDRQWPPEAVMSEEVRRLVLERWEDYGL